MAAASTIKAALFAATAALALDISVLINLAEVALLPVLDIFDCDLVDLGGECGLLAAASLWTNSTSP